MILYTLNFSGMHFTEEMLLEEKTEDVFRYLNQEFLYSMAKNE